MKSSEYKKAQPVAEFINWISKYLDEPCSLSYKYYNKKSRSIWKCDSIYSAFINYEWSFSYVNNDNKYIKGKTYQESKQALNDISISIKEGILDNDNMKVLTACDEVLQWGGVKRKNYDVLKEMGNGLVDYLKMVKEQFSKDLSYDMYYNNDIYMNSGFTKIYSLLMDDYIIYDSRVGAALGFFVREFCSSLGLKCIPDELCFAWGTARSGASKISDNMRNPSNTYYKFPNLAQDPKRHTENNVRANWLIKEILYNTSSKFNDIDSKDRMRAFEASLFMIGYSVISEK